jgi:hypothetical protein
MSVFTVTHPGRPVKKGERAAGEFDAMCRHDKNDIGYYCERPKSHPGKHMIFFAGRVNYEWGLDGGGEDEPFGLSEGRW